MELTSLWVTRSLAVCMLVGFAIVILSRSHTRKWLLVEKNKNNLLFWIGAFALAGKITTTITAIVLKLYWQLFTADFSNFINALFILLLFKRFRTDFVFKLLTPSGILAGVAAFFGGGLSFDSWLYLSLLSIAGHAFLIVGGFLVSIFVVDWTKKDYMKVYGVYTIYLFYVFMVCAVPYMVTGDPRWGMFSTGMVRSSWEENVMNGMTFAFYRPLSEIPMPYPIPVLMYYGSAYLMLFVTSTILSAVRHWYYHDKVGTK